MWIPIAVRHDKGFLRVAERSLRQHLCDELNKLEEEYRAPVVNVHVLQHEPDKYAELLVRVDTSGIVESNKET